MANKTKALASKLTIDMTKPLVKEYVDKDKALAHFIETMLPHQLNSQIKVMYLYTNQNDITKYRVNWYQENINGLIGNTKITASKYIQIENTRSGYKITDLTVRSN